MADRQMIDWSFFSMARYLLTADPADGSVIAGRRRVLDERLRQVTRLQQGSP